MTDQEFVAELEAIRSDRTSGAAELARRCLEIAAETCQQDNSPSTRELLARLNIRIDQLAQSRPSMAPVANILRIFQEDIKELTHFPLEEAGKQCVNKARQTIEASLKSTQKTAVNASEFIGGNRTVFTHSYSSTILQTFTLLAENEIKVIVSEARPLCEGYRLAEKLSQMKIPTTLITDAQTGLFIAEADIVLVGADTILPDFSVMNKAGTYLLALAAHDNNIPLYVCSEKYKQLQPGSITPELEAMDGAELNGPELPFVTIENIYFDITPAKFITGWINEDGVVQVHPR
ncbi:MAG: translation initiation factor eIF-2B [Deltaproteobacteria bacterium]|jgi:translation initiation factor eIF-2B subunit delta|nr:translation initiation factor eIF-2B [Deltaproteobacteria bacterium]